jgi:CheY-like chemotaxis protein
LRAFASGDERSITSIPDGQSCVERLSLEKFDVVLMDPMPVWEA